MKNLLVMERYVLEALETGAKNFSQTHEATGIDYALLNNILSDLTTRNMVSYKQGLYSLNLSGKAGWLPQINSGENLNAEVKELFSTMVSHHFTTKSQDKELKVQKLFMTQEEERIFQSYLINMEKFIKDVQREQKVRGQQGKVREQKLIVWGKASYESVVQTTLKAI
jgi:hypothetical protein